MNKKKHKDQLDKTAERPRESPEETRAGATGIDERPVEIGGRGGPDPTRFGDWEKGGRCVDF